MNKQEKAQKLIDDDMIFIATENENVVLFVCKGLSGQVYEVFYHKVLDSYKCGCENVRGNRCYHKVAAHKVRTGLWEVGKEEEVKE